MFPLNRRAHLVIAKTPALGSLNTWKREETFFSSYFLPRRFPLSNSFKLSSRYSISTKLFKHSALRNQTVFRSQTDGTWKNKRSKIIFQYFLTVKPLSSFTTFSQIILIKHIAKIYNNITASRNRTSLDRVRREKLRIENESRGSPPPRREDSTFPGLLDRRSPPTREPWSKVTRHRPRREPSTTPSTHVRSSKAAS